MSAAISICGPDFAFMVSDEYSNKANKLSNEEVCHIDKLNKDVLICVAGKPDIVSRILNYVEKYKYDDLMAILYALHDYVSAHYSSTATLRIILSGRSLYGEFMSYSINNSNNFTIINQKSNGDNFALSYFSSYKNTYTTNIILKHIITDNNF